MTRRKLSKLEADVKGAVTTYSFKAPAGWSQWFLFQSDVHFDSMYCNRDLLYEHLQEAKRRSARVMIFGDFFDAMQGRHDKRSSKSELRPEYKREDYFDFLVKDSADFLKPFSHNIALMADGNHELSVLKNNNTNLLDRLAFLLNIQTGSEIKHGGYGGWVRSMFYLSDGENTGGRTSIKTKYFHGSGGEAPVTRGVIQTNRQAVYLPDANIVVNGHNHHQYYVPISRERISGKGVQFFDIQHHIRIPGYKQGYGDGTTGWEVTRGGVPKPIGAVWVRLYNLNEQIRIEVIADIRGAEPVGVDPNLLYPNDPTKLDTGGRYADDPEGE